MINSFINPVKELLKGLYIVLKNGFKNRVTLEYPEKKKTPSNNFRGKIKYIKENCIKCGICKKVCPLKDCIMTDKTFTINYAQCIFCGNCVEYCTKKALVFSKEYELASDNKQDFLLKEEN